MKQSPNPPVYAQVAFDIAAKIAAGELKIGERFTGRSLMGSQYGVSAETIRRALRHLEEMGIISTQVNVGSTVRSKKRAVEYVDQFQSGKDLWALKCQLRELIARRDALNAEITGTLQRILDLSERFRRSDRLRTYEFPVEADTAAAGQSIGALQFRQNTGATIVALRKGEELVLSPGPEARLERGDVVVVACEVGQLERVSSLLGHSVTE